MCGIAGIVSSEALDASIAGRVEAMRDVLVHRGPDDAGLWTDAHAALGHRRLSIVDLGGGHQPMGNETGTIQVIFNGEIYNHAGIRRELEAHGHRYRTKSDTETLVHAYEQWGDEFVHRLRGMFAFAVWDAPRRRLLLVRDRLGIKPLYWTRRGDRLLFGSEIKALLASGLVPAEARHDLIPEVLGTRYVSGPATLFRDIQALEPGHLLVFEAGEVRIRQYWDVPAGDRREPAPSADLVGEFGDLLDESVRLRLMSDVPLGVFLSGGIDSSAIAALMARHMSSPLQTFSVAFADRAFNELEYSRQVARAIGAEAHETVIDDHDFFGALPRLLWHEDEPIAHPSSVPLHFVSALARRHATVILTGEGSDELLAGYGKYARTTWNWRAAGLYERVVPARLRRSLAAELIPRLPGRLRRPAARSFLAVERTPGAMLFDNFASIRLGDQGSLLTREARAAAGAAGAYDTSCAYFAAPPPGSTFLDRMLYADIKTYLVELLMKQDQMSMSASIESRVPFLDHRLVEFAARLPDRWKLAGWTTKRILRYAMRGVLPPAILNRPKLGFPVPFGRWTRGAWNGVLRDVLLDPRTRARGIVDPVAADRLLQDHAAGRTAGGDRLWSLLNLELWFRTFIDHEGVQTLPAVPARPSPSPPLRTLAATPAGTSPGA